MSAPKITRKKTRPEAFEHALSPEQLSQLYIWCTAGFQVARLNAAQEWGLKVGKTALARWYHKDDNLKVLAFISSGAHMTRQIEAAYQENPAPEIETLIKLCKTLVMQLSVQGATDPQQLQVANSLFGSVLEFLKIQEKAEDRKLNRDKFQIEACEFFLQWFNDKRAQEIAGSTASNAEKIALLRKTYFKDVDELQASGKVVLPE